MRKRLVELNIKPKELSTAMRVEKTLECVLCIIHYSFQDVSTGNYHIDTHVCSYCYLMMKQAPMEQSCFGKPTTLREDGRKLLGYSEKAYDCSSVCPDRELCRLLVAPLIEGKQE